MKKFFKALLWIVIVAGVLATIGFVLEENKAANDAKTAIVAQENSSVLVRTEAVNKQALNLGFSVNGNFIPSQELSFASEKSGRVVKVMVKEGDAVRVGQVLATIRVDQLNVDRQNAEAIYQNALKDLARYESAYSTGGITQQQLEQAKLAVENAKSRIEQIEINIGDASIRSSINGIIAERKIEPGSVLNPGAQMFDIVNVAQVKLKVPVSESQVIQIKEGDQVKVTASVFPDKEFTGRVTFISPRADQSLNFPVEIEVSNNAGKDLKAGMFGTAHFEEEEVKEAILVPRTAFVGSVSSNEVFMLEADSTAHIRKVIAGRIIEDQVEILDGLQEGDILITSGQVNLSDGTKVSPVH
ncbi:efflux RND transporter periplasmic adaptor subunit [Flavilitoribacter nigricans]|uniref:Efflux transporter periplasmic adaptor subunit n=1 Tax=Flavilitoribacter nigricans (strain ATCC 23147 / DSM 23189 / NBRC 102662 / NCIMB 1420 / SS-2) TaxID=1122177 RepID=A0A2D0MX07_FLAN2|nr:efflux RND transporter periplasmic adaptor subunit [Flavilitoribacter nigricans]PHN00737.1 efflux transporter periplasmic adaptor subunit [Flavilitoribacter nigricans DSM 23189 = NBRC 102662]